MPFSVRAFIRYDGGKGYKAECLEVEATASGATIDDTVNRLRNEVCRKLDSVTREQLGLDPEPTLFITLEDVPLAPVPMGCRCRHGGGSM